ncbi:MAG: putative sulfate exporter family transporter [Longicatena sp.]
MYKVVSFAKERVYGFLCCFAVAMIAKQIGSYVPQIGGALFAIFIGMFCGNTFLTSKALDKGTKFSESKLLEFSIILMGATLNMNDIIQVGFQGVLFIFIQMSVTIIVCYIIGRKLHFTKKFSLLMCSGNAVCGSSAIGSIAPIIDADSNDKGISITIVNVMGTMLMIILPIIVGALFHNMPLPSGALIGGTLQSVGQVIASAKLVSDGVVQMATVFKIIRIIFLVVVAFVFSYMNTKEGERLFQKQTASHKKIKAKIPYFIIGFFLFSILHSFSLVPTLVQTSAKFLSNNFEIIALAAIGMRVKIKDLLKQGPKAMLYGCLVCICQIIFAITLIKLLII